jgi:hypothetical protein
MEEAEIKAIEKAFPRYIDDFEGTELYKGDDDNINEAKKQLRRNLNESEGEAFGRDDMLTALFKTLSVSRTKGKIVKERAEE